MFCECFTLFGVKFSELLLDTVIHGLGLQITRGEGVGGWGGWKRRDDSVVRYVKSGKSTMERRSIVT